jgi:hypothetical protein
MRATSHFPEEFLRRHPSGDGVSSRYFKRVLLISECNGRISELRRKGFEIETSNTKDEFGLAYHRLKPQLDLQSTPERLKDAASWFERLSTGAAA